MDEQKMADPCIHCNRAVKFPEDNLDCPLKCEGCGFLPWTKVSQQPHGASTLYCNRCTSSQPHSVARRIFVHIINAYLIARTERLSSCTTSSIKTERSCRVGRQRLYQIDGRWEIHLWHTSDSLSIRRDQSIPPRDSINDPNVCGGAILNRQDHIAYMMKKRDKSVKEFEKLYSTKGESWADFFTVTTRGLLNWNSTTKA